MKTRRNVSLLILPSIFCCSAVAFAQSPPGAIPVGPMFLYPALEIAIKHDDNVALRPGALARSDTIGLIRPSFRLEGQQGVNIYSVGYRGEFATYQDITRFNYNAHVLDANANMTFDARNRLVARAQFIDGVDQPGTLNVVPTVTPNKYYDASIAGRYTYGAEGAQGRLELVGQYADRKYVNNEIVTAQLNHSTAEYGGTFLWRVFPKTYATITAKQAIYDYESAFNNLDSKDTFLLAGVRWEATAATAGRFSLGRQRKDFDSPTIAGDTYTSWEGGINWRPLTYTSVDYNTRRSTTDSTGLGNYSVTQIHQVTWTHAWSSRVTSVLTGIYLNDQYVNAPVPGAGGAQREDTTKSFGLRGTYQMLRWLNLGADYTHTTRDSNDVNFRYNRNVYMLFARGTL